MPESPKNALPVGHVIDKYRIGDVLGSGGFGIVYRGQHQDLGLDVAIKEYLPLEIAVREGTSVQPLSSESREHYDDGLRRFLDEAKRLVQFNHPNVVRCRDFRRTNGTAYLIMDFEDGLPLSELLISRKEQDNPLSEDEIKRIVLPLLDGLDAVHAHGVLHRDIKPANIFIRRSTEQPVLIDFGSAKQGFSEHSKSMAPYTEGYAAMEQIEAAGNLGPWTDIYALGAVMWRMVANDNPPKVEDRSFAAVRGKPDPMVSALEIGKERYSGAFLQAIDKCLEVQEESRYQSAEALQDALRTQRRAVTEDATGTPTAMHESEQMPSHALASGRRLTTSHRSLKVVGSLKPYAVVAGKSFRYAAISTALLVFFNEAGINRDWTFLLIGLFALSQLGAVFSMSSLKTKLFWEAPVWLALIVAWSISWKSYPFCGFGMMLFVLNGILMCLGFFGSVMYGLFKVFLKEDNETLVAGFRKLMLIGVSLAILGLAFASAGNAIDGACL